MLILKQKQRFLSIFKGYLDFFKYLEGAGLTKTHYYGII